jgi:hypothetical protein
MVVGGMVPEVEWLDRDVLTLLVLGELALLACFLAYLLPSPYPPFPLNLIESYLVLTPRLVSRQAWRAGQPARCLEPEKVVSLVTKSLLPQHMPRPARLAV